MRFIAYNGTRCNSAWEDATKTILVLIVLEDGIEIYPIGSGPNHVGTLVMKIRRNMMIQLEFCNRRTESYSVLSDRILLTFP